MGFSGFEHLKHHRNMFRSIRCSGQKRSAGARLIAPLVPRFAIPPAGYNFGLASPAGFLSLGSWSAGSLVAAFFTPIFVESQTRLLVNKTYLCSEYSVVGTIRRVRK